MTVPVAIIGGGLAGLCAARQLQAARIGFLLLEARQRLGGRILTVDERGQPADDGFDLGPSWFWPAMQPAIGELIGELGLASFPQNSGGDVVFERMSREPAQRYRPFAAPQQSMRLTGGTAALVRALAADLPPEQIRTGAQVTALALRGEGIDLTIRLSNGVTESLSAGRVIAALPPRLLDASVSFTPAQDAPIARRWRATPTWMAPHAKFFAFYERPFWRDAGLSGTAQSMVGPLAEVHDATTASGRAALFGFLGVGAEQRRKLGDEILTAACLSQLERIFGEEAGKPRATLVKDWAADPLTATPADGTDDGHVPESNAPWVSGPWRDRLLLAGSEASPVEPGYLAGAVVAARRAVDAIVATLPALARAHR